jgi:hypothetical protein
VRSGAPWVSQFQKFCRSSPLRTSKKLSLVPFGRFLIASRASWAVCPGLGCRGWCLFPVDELNRPVSRIGPDVDRFAAVGDRFLVEGEAADIASGGGELRADFTIDGDELGYAATNVSGKRLCLRLALRHLGDVARCSGVGHRKILTHNETSLARVIDFVEHRALGHADITRASTGVQRRLTQLIGLRGHGRPVVDGPLNQRVACLTSPAQAERLLPDLPVNVIPAVSGGCPVVGGFDQMIDIPSAYLREGRQSGRDYVCLTVIRLARRAGQLKLLRFRYRR